MDKEILIKEYEKDIELYMFHINTAVKISVWVIAVTGAILTYYFKNLSAHEGNPLRLVLIFPFFINVAFGILCWRSLSMADNLANDHIRISKELGIKTPIKLNGLSYLLFLYLLMCFGVATGIVIAFFSAQL